MRLWITSRIQGHWTNHDKTIFCSFIFCDVLLASISYRKTSDSLRNRLQDICTQYRYHGVLFSIQQKVPRAKHPLVRIILPTCRCRIKFNSPTPISQQTTLPKCHFSTNHHFYKRRARQTDEFKVNYHDQSRNCNAAKNSK